MPDTLSAAILASIGALIALKPLIDAFWSWKLHIGSGAINLQGFVAVSFVGVGLVLVGRTLLSRSSPLVPRKAAWLYLAFLALAAHHAASVPGSTEWVVKHLSGLSGFLAVYWLLSGISKSDDARRRLSQGVYFSLVCVLTSGLAQLFGFLGWTHMDTLYRIGNIGRLTGFYFHPLDLIRVAIWVHLALLVALFQKRAPGWQLWLGLLGLEFLLFRTTYRVSLIFCGLCPLLFAIYYKDFKRGAVVFLAILAAWTAWSFVPGQQITLYDVFQPQHFLDWEKHKKTDSTGHVVIEEQFDLGRGRSEIWRLHARWISRDFSALDWTIGWHKPIPKDYDNEPHNQLLDLLESFGIAGILIVPAFFWAMLSALEGVPFVWKGLFAVAACWFSITSEPLTAPTFVWWGALFAAIPLWLKPMRTGPSV